MNIAQGWLLFMTLVAVAMMGSEIKRGECELRWWVYLIMVAAFLWDYKLVGG